MDVTTPSYETYKRLDEKENCLFQQLEVCESAQGAILDLLYRSDGPINNEVFEEILNAIQTISLRLQSKLLALKLEKTTVARQLRKST